MIQLINLKRQAALDRSTILHNINNDIKNANFILGKKNILLEKNIKIFKFKILLNLLIRNRCSINVFVSN